MTYSKRSWYTPFTDRIHIVFLNKVHMLRIYEIQAMTGMKYTTILGILQAHNKMGHVNNQWNLLAKQRILRFR